jgi:zinc protease
VTATLARGLTPVRTVLENGAVVICQSTPLTPAITISAMFRAGSLYDPPELPGLAHLTGRVLDRGTARRNAAVIAEELDDRGVALKISTNRHALTVSCTCLVEDFDDVFAIVADVARRPTFPEAEIAKRRGETLTSLRQDEDNPAVRSLQAVLALIYGPLHPYGRPVKGTAASIERIGRDDLVAFHRARVRPAALSLVVVGDVRLDRLLDRSRAELADWSAAAPDPVGVPASGGVRQRTVRTIPMPGKSQTDIAYGFTAIRRTDPRYYAYWMMNNILGQFGLGGRLADNIRERQGMAYYAYSTLDPAVGEAPLLIRAGVDPRNVRRALEAIDHEVARLGSEGPTAQEVEETREYLVGSIPRLLETNQSIASFLQMVEEFGLGLDYDQRLPGLLRAVTPEQIRAAAFDVLDPARAAIAMAGPPVEDDR